MIFEFKDRVESDNGYVIKADLMITKKNDLACILLQGIHKLLGHAGTEVTKLTALKNEWKFDVQDYKCEDCALAKSKKKKIAKKSKRSI